MRHWSLTAPEFKLVAYLALGYSKCRDSDSTFARRNGQEHCPRCTGQGTIRDTKSLALAILRLIQEEAAKDRTGEVQAVVPVDVSAFLLNEKRSDINEIESRSGVRIVVVASPYLDTPHFEVRRLRDDEIDQSRRLSSMSTCPRRRSPRRIRPRNTGVGAGGVGKGRHTRGTRPRAPSEKEKEPQQKKSRRGGVTLKSVATSNPNLRGCW